MTTAAWPPGILTLALFDSGLTHFFYEVIKIVVVAAAALVGWMAGPSLVRLLVRLAFHRPTPASILTFVSGTFARSGASNGMVRSIGKFAAPIRSCSSRP